MAIVSELRGGWVQRFPFEIFGRAWRTLLTGFLFIAFGLGSLTLSFGVFNLLALVAPRSQRRRKIFRLFVRGVFTVFFFVINRAGLISYSVRGREKLRGLRGTIVIANHPSLIDIVCLLSLCPNATCIVKPALKRNIFLRGVIICANYIFASDFENMTMDVGRALAEGENLIVFPEGTRTGHDENLKLQRGTAKLALNLNAPVLPILIRVQPRILSKTSVWHETGRVRASFIVSVGEVFKLDTVVEPGAPPSLASRAATRYFAEVLTDNRSVIA